MATLARELRQELRRTVERARRAAEAGARKAIEQLRVGDAEAPRHLSGEQQSLRRRLRAHGRQLGDRRDEKRGTQETGRLIQECAYEHWHRMLFARFLAEADLLIEPQSGVAVSLEEVQDLSRAQSRDWLALASDFAERMLPQIFRKGDPVLDISLPRETRQELEDLMKGLPRAVFTADDSLGWVYQCWQAEKKDEINGSGKKIGADELPAVTQLFTEDYMVLFLLHNTLGAWWAGKVLAERPDIAASAGSEDELRAVCNVGDVEWTYLRFVRENGENGAEGAWRPAAGVFEGWPRAAKEITILDPCMGSGHFLVFALRIMVAFRIAEENLSREAAIESVLRDSLFGLEIDPRCTQIAAFNLAFAAWRTAGYRALPPLNLACSGLAIGVAKEEWLRLAQRAAEQADPDARRDIFGIEQNIFTAGALGRLRIRFEQLHDLFAKAPSLGSLIDPRRSFGKLSGSEFDELQPVLQKILETTRNADVAELAVAARGIVKAAEFLGRSFTLVTTNVPYLGRGKQSSELISYVDEYHSVAKSDLATCFVERCLTFCSKGGSAAVVTSQNWLFLGSYTKLRRVLLKGMRFSIVCDLGPAAFNEMNWWAARTALVVLSDVIPSNGCKYLALNADTGRDLQKKLQVLINCAINSLEQSDQLANPDSKISVHASPSSQLLAQYADVYVGFQNGDTPRWVQNLWEQKEIDGGWSVFQLPSENTASFAGRHSIIKWDNGSGELARSEQARIQGTEAWGKRGVIVRQTRHLPAGLYFGDMYDQSNSVIVPKDEAHFSAIAAFVMSRDFHNFVRQIHPSVVVTNATFVKVPFDLAKWTKVGEEKFPGKVPNPCSADPTQWLFDGHPKDATAPLLVACARLLGYRWPRLSGGSFAGCPALGADGLESHYDGDGIVCLTAAKGEAPAHERLSALLADAFGTEWSAAKLASLLADVGFTGKSLDDWLRDGFFERHCELFRQRPFIWHVWDGRSDGFHTLVNYHRLAAPNAEGRRTLERLIYSYLGDWIDRQRADQKAGVEGADGRVAAAVHLRSELVKILEGEPPYDTFIRWKPLAEQAIGWEPDINDGVRLNIRPFMTARPLGATAKNACILRTTPKIKWDRDRGKEPVRDRDDYPWFWGWRPDDPGLAVNFLGGEAFDGVRWNDLHYTRARKQEARDRRAGKAA